ncbi:hypothetical protein CVM52_04960 [Pseudooceanicola lipolyticus]|uniref:Uncharacterized protein n=3 Tax=Alphaproteobacteria TaxID=28211 RepID=A0A2M8J4Y8_9RHOB|nr:hypothetical protein BOO69_22320 [Sulfitobacter alexandrii]PJE37849.1 hypothetical protein CVM52_04960 [Pseudooceanicola lipolyticus]
MSSEVTIMRWDPYIFRQGEDFDAFWQKYANEPSKRFLFVLGRGYDPRALSVLDKIVEFGGEVDVWLLAFDNGFQDSELRIQLTLENVKKLEALVGASKIREIEVSLGRSGKGNATSRNVRQALRAAGSLGVYTDVVVDISAMPRMVALTAVASLLHELDKMSVDGPDVNLHVTTAESVSADIGAARGTLRDDVTNVIGFGGQLDSESTDQIPRVWFPVLGEQQGIRLSRIRDKLNPDEICPVIPFPTREPRRGDEIIREHRQLLFEEFQVEPGNILRASEYNPFEAYKQIFAAMDRYRRALSELGGCKAFVSPLSSKLLSVGALLACYDHRYGAIAGDRMSVGVLYVETADYSDPVIESDTEYQLSSMWLRGDWER